MKITNKMIEDVYNCLIGNNDLEETKNNLKQKGYEVEEEKSYLEQAREYKLDVIMKDHHSPAFYNLGEVKDKIKLYEKAIEEEQNKKQLKIDDVLIEWLRFLRDSSVYEFNYFDEIQFDQLAERLLKQLGVKE